MELIIAFSIALGLNILLFIPAYIFKTDVLTDASYALTFIVIALYGLYLSTSIFSLILAAMVFIWALRLGGYLFIRIRKMGKDSRFDERRNSFVRFGAFWVLQGITVWAVMIPSVLFFKNDIKTISIYAYLGIFIWALGLLIESISDMQKFRFINNPENKGKWIQKGLWKYSRHPNYFGEILLWFGVFIYASFGLSGNEILIGGISPLYIATLIIFVSGIPLLEKSADKRWNSNPQYHLYKKQTSILIPWKPKYKEGI